MEKIDSVVPYALRWRQVAANFQSIKRMLKRDQAMSEGILAIALHLRREAILLGSETILGRVDFLRAMQVRASALYLTSFYLKHES